MDPLLETLLDGAPDDEIEAIIKLRDPRVVPEAVRIIARFDDIATVRLRRGDIESVHADGAVLSLKASREIVPDLAIPEPLPSEELEALAEATERRPEGLDVTGEGVVVGILDYDLDFVHPEFRTEGGETRLLALWDQRTPRGLTPRNRYGKGRIFSAERIQRALDSSDPYADLAYTPKAGGHGTHVAGIAAGSGRVGPGGVAPGARIVFVHLSTPGSSGLNNLGDAVGILEGIDFVRRVAAERPWVVNLSVGKHGGPHDGTTLVEQGFDRVLREHPNRAIVNSAGNYYDKRIHASGHVPRGGRAELSMRIGSADRTQNELEIWYPGSDRFVVEVISPDRRIRKRLALGQTERIWAGGRTVASFHHRASDPGNGDNHVDLFFNSPAVPSGRWLVRLHGERVRSGRYDAWIERDASDQQSRFDPPDDKRITIGTIATGRLSLVTAAYDRAAEEGPDKVPRFSSSGPTRDGRQKPDLAAPGRREVSARALGNEADGTLLIAMSGTSMASPHVCGTVALVLEKATRPLAIDEIRKVVMLSATRDPAGRYPRERIGRGFLDIERAVEYARRVSRHATPPRQVRRAMGTRRTRRRADASGAPRRGGAGRSGVEVLPSPSLDKAEACGCSHAVAASPDDALRDRLVLESRPDDADRAELIDDDLLLLEPPATGVDDRPVRLVERAEESLHSGVDPMQWWQSLLGTQDSPGAVFDRIAYGGGALAPSGVELIAGPREWLNEPVRAGDVLLRRGDGVHAHPALLLGSDWTTEAQLASTGWQAEAQGAGRYAPVIEAGGRPHCGHDVFARRITDGSGAMPANQLLLRLVEGGLDEEEALETAASVRIAVRNRLIREAVPDVEVALSGTSASGRSDASGNLQLDLSGVADGSYRLRVTPRHSFAGVVGSALAEGGAVPARIWRPIDSPVTVRAGAIVSATDAGVQIAGRRVSVRLQPVWMSAANSSVRRDPVSLVIVHHTAGPRIGPAINWFLNAQGPSAHYVIDVDGQIVKMVQEARVSWHAGTSYWGGRVGVNSRSIGIEIVHRAGAYPDVQYRALIALLGQIRAAHPGVTPEGIIGHADIATNRPTPQHPRRLGRKWGDPGLEFDWARLRAAGFSPTVRAGPQDVRTIYGGFFDAHPNGRLQIGDRDSARRFGAAARSGIRGNPVDELQRDLQGIGYYCPADGDYGRTTAATVRSFQEHFFSGPNRVRVPMGEVDALTAQVIKSVA